MYKIYISSGGKPHSYYELNSLPEANGKVQHLMQRNPNLTYTIEKD